MMDDWKKKKVAIYLRRSKGDTGDTESQLDRIEPLIRALEKEGKIKKVNRSIVGRQFKYSKEEGRFKSARDLARVGDIFNEGDGQSAFDSARSRVVLGELLKRMREGEYEAVLAETLDRYSRDPLDFAQVALDDWRKNGKQFASLKESFYYGSPNPLDESIITTQLMWGGEAKKGESRKSRNALEKKIDVGYITKPKAELRGSGSKGQGRDYRNVWARMLTFGETPEGRLKTPGQVGKSFGRDHTWASNFYEIFKQWNSYVYPDGETALEKWFDAVDSVNQFIAEYPMARDGDSYKQKEVKQLIKSANGFLAYPAGVNPSNKYPTAQNQFILFPNPTDFDLNELATQPDPNMIQGWSVIREPLGNRPLMKHQTQFRGAGGKGKRLV
ncbi:recombinase family protein [Candidatus Poseidoniaceae archaeon]|nr:recombinase family protein [Candidatus Poseidoniaceae archaeon]